MPLRVVFDTNTVVSALLFASGRLAWLRQAWRGAQVQPLASRETVSELLRVLAYSKFRLTAEEREELLAEYLPYIEVVRRPGAARGIPLCRDPADRPFLQVAVAGRARVLVTGDADLLVLGAVGACTILRPEELRQRLSGKTGGQAAPKPGA